MVGMARRAAVVVDTDLGFNKIVDDLLKANKYSIQVGIQEGTKTPGIRRRGNQQPAGKNVAQYAAENEFGTQKIPQRSFMRSAFDQNLDKIEAMLVTQLRLVTDGQTLITALKIVGTMVQDLVKQKINSITFPPNSPMTIALKKSSKPLIDFGTMFASVRYVVRKR
jgi:HK97 gp10 family phage protein